MFGLFVRRGAFDPPPDQGEGGVGVACCLCIHGQNDYINDYIKEILAGHYVPPTATPT